MAVATGRRQKGRALLLAVLSLAAAGGARGQLRASPGLDRRAVKCPNLPAGCLNETTIQSGSCLCGDALLLEPDKQIPNWDEGRTCGREAATWRCLEDIADPGKAGDVAYMREHCCFRRETCDDVFTPTMTVDCDGVCRSRVQAAFSAGSAASLVHASAWCDGESRHCEGRTHSLEAFTWDDAETGRQHAGLATCCAGDDCIERHAALREIEFQPDCGSPKARACVAPLMDAFKCSLDVDSMAMQFTDLGAELCSSGTSSATPSSAPPSSASTVACVSASTGENILCGDLPNGAGEACAYLHVMQAADCTQCHTCPGGWIMGVTYYGNGWTQECPTAVDDKGWHLPPTRDEDWALCGLPAPGQAGPPQSSSGSPGSRPAICKKNMALNFWELGLDVYDPCASSRLFGGEMGCLSQACDQCEHATGGKCAIADLPAPGCLKHMIGDGYCHGVCMNADAGMDGGDCHALVQGLKRYSVRGFSAVEQDGKRYQSHRNVQLEALKLVSELVTDDREKVMATLPEEVKPFAEKIQIWLKHHMIRNGTNSPAWNMATIMVLFADENSDGVLSEEEALSFFPALAPESFQALATQDHNGASISVADVAQTLATLHAWIGIDHPAFPTTMSLQDVETTLFQLLDLDADSHLSPIELHVLGIGSELVNVLVEKAITMAPMGGFEASDDVSFNYWSRMLKQPLADCSQIVYVDGSGDLDINVAWLPKGHCDILILPRTKIPAPFNVSGAPPQCGSRGGHSARAEPPNPTIEDLLKSGVCPVRARK